MNVPILRIYDSFDDPAGFRILVDRVWPRGVSKEKARLDKWYKDIAPSTELREWFSHKPERYKEFHTKYLAELDKNPNTPAFVELVASHKDTVLLYGAKDKTHNQAAVLQDYLKKC